MTGAFQDEWPREGSWAIGVCLDGKECMGALVTLSKPLSVIRTSEGVERPVEGLRRPEWGSYCPHGAKVVEAVPAVHTCGRPADDPAGSVDLKGLCSSDCPACYPAGRKVQPWPCTEDGCTEANFDKATEAEIEEYWEAVNDLMRTQYE